MFNTLTNLIPKPAIKAVEKLAYKIPISIQLKIGNIVNSNRWLLLKVNEITINAVVNSCRHRPHPWSTAHSYVSWKSLSDTHWSARHLPASQRNRPSTDEAIGKLAELFKRRNGRQELCKKSTCLFPAFAQYLTDGFIRTRMPESRHNETEMVKKQNTSNHQIDLCTLYGRTENQTNQLREKSNEFGKRGRLKSQILDEEYSPFLYDEKTGNIKEEFNLLDIPLGIDHCDQKLVQYLFATGGDRVNSAPQVAMINTLFLREHNRLASVIENMHPDWDDERVFQTARNTVIVEFIKIVVEEYINHISPSPFLFVADPKVAWDSPWNKPNWITTEFSLLYRWHSLIPDEISWSGKKYPVHKTLMNNKLLLDSGLIQAFVDLSFTKAARLGPFNTNFALMDFELKAIRQDLLCELDTYAKYCEYMGEAIPNDFSDISADKDVQNFLKDNYKSADAVDFYIGIFSEDTVRNSPLPRLILGMVAVDAFSQALTNPLLSRHVYKKDTFSEAGWTAIQETHSLLDILKRNCSNSRIDGRISMTQEDWQMS